MERIAIIMGKMHAGGKKTLSWNIIDILIEK